MDVPGTWIVLTLLAALGCAPTLPVPDPVPFKALESGIQSGIERPREVVVRTAGDWKTLCAEHSAGRPCPAVDFTRSTVIGVFLGTRPSAGYAVAITGVERDGDALVVTYRERKPGPDEMAAQMLTMPYQLATVDSFAGPVRFVRAR
jgi:PrcB C-terminal